MKKYMKPKAEVIELETEDVITASGDPDPVAQGEGIELPLD